MQKVGSFHSKLQSEDHFNATVYTPSTAETSCCSYSSHQKLGHKHNNNSLYKKAAPLTAENLSKILTIDSTHTPLARYCNELAANSAVFTESNTSTSARRKARQRIQDEVIESPRLLPFPYHNDSRFLPTAEHDYPGRCSEASSSFVNISFQTMGYRQTLPSISSTYHSNQSQSKDINMLQKCYDDISSYKRRADSVTPSSPSTLRDECMVPQEKHRISNELTSKLKQNLLFKASSDTVPKDHVVDSSRRTRSWYTKLWKFLKPSYIKKNHRNSNCSTSAPVWYSQFRCNPPPPPSHTPVNLSY
ncbi:hypothetical protein CU098_013081 [Rhizopus stolonifer]|uniref:Uncharacterized protein n=1 Tax=Rhizopus stolonifer TaxID=4846 RepID=A0A367KT33_RHIST|nr:hypothetical protein CU098_013081 [Rhizopus stolonifer]